MEIFEIDAKDHPRVRGEKKACGTRATVTTGSPPRVRGEEFPILPAGERITPACAGRSTERKTGKRRRVDHPRVCGEKFCKRK